MSLSSFFTFNTRVVKSSHCFFPCVVNSSEKSVVMKFYFSKKSCSVGAGIFIQFEIKETKSSFLDYFS
jgi:hypothetical protein